MVQSGSLEGFSWADGVSQDCVSGAKLLVGCGGAATAVD